VGAALKKFGLLAGNMKFSTQNEVHAGFNVLFFLYITCNKYIITIKEKITKYATQNPGHFVATFSTFLQNELLNIMYVSINK